jgi:hypothetical protein
MLIIETKQEYARTPQPALAGANSLDYVLLFFKEQLLRKLIGGLTKNQQMNE